MIQHLKDLRKKYNAILETNWTYKDGEESEPTDKIEIV